MKVKALSRNPDDYLRETKKDIHKVQRNYDPALHPFEETREYTHAMNAAKLERVFAKPFLGSLDGHKDGIHCLCKSPTSLSTLLSGACDGEIRLWNLPNQQCMGRVAAHDGFVRGICFQPDGQTFFSCGNDKTIKQWSVENAMAREDSDPVNTIIGKTVFQGIDHHKQDRTFATCGEVVELWDEERTEPIRTFKWDTSTLHSLKFNPIEHDLIAATASDRGIILYDTRGSAPLRKTIMKLQSNKIAWNPLEAFMFTAANEDYHLYTYDMRNLREPLFRHAGHISAVLDIDFAPTGKEFVAGSYDKTIRIFPFNDNRSREVYHTKRMQRVSSVAWSLDNKFIVSGSDEMNLRVWKANASEKLGALRPREKAAFAYSEKLKDKFSHHPQVKRILKHRHIPRHIYNGARENHIMRESVKRRERNIKSHSKPGSVKFQSAIQKSMIKEVE